MTDKQTPIFEIDQPEIYGDLFLTHKAQIISYLRALEKQHAMVTIYIGDGHSFFISTLVAVDEASGNFFLDIAKAEEVRRLTERTPKLTLTATLDKVKIQIRVENQRSGQHNGRTVLTVPLPKTLLRLQRREYFRLETPQATPLHCKLQQQGKVFNLSLLDLSGGGISLLASPLQADLFAQGSIFPECRLEIPGDGFIAVNLCIKKVTLKENQKGQTYLRIGCEFLNLPGTRLAQIQRYITRIERERKTRNL